MTTLDAESVRAEVRTLFGSAVDKVATLILGGTLTVLELQHRLRVLTGEEAVRSTIADLDPELREVLDKLIAEGRFTLRQIVAHMRSLGVDLSKSAVHRHKSGLDRVASQVRMAREAMAAVGKELDETDTNATRTIVTLVQSAILALYTRIDDDEEGLDPKSISLLATAARDLQSALKSSVDTEIAIRAKVAKEAAAAASKVATARGLSAEVTDAIQASILGITDKRAS